MSETAGEDGRRRLRPWMVLPAGVALALVALFFVQLGREDREDLPSPLIGKAVPDFDLPGLGDRPGLATADLSAPGVKLVNVFASWCVPCRVEHPQIEALAARGIPVHGLNYKDAPGDAERFLAELGDPYARVGRDEAGRVGIEWGVYGVPETFVIDGEGKIVHKHVGPIQADDLETRIMPAIARARSGS